MLRDKVKKVLSIITKMYIKLEEVYYKIKKPYTEFIMEIDETKRPGYVKSCSNCKRLTHYQFAFFKPVYGCSETKRIRDHKTVIYNADGSLTTLEHCEHWKSRGIYKNEYLKEKEVHKKKMEMYYRKKNHN